MTRLAWIAVAVLTAVGVAGIPRLEFDDDYRSVFRSDADAYELLEEVSEQFGAQDREILVVVSGASMTSPLTLRALSSLQDSFSLVEGVEGVDSVISVSGLWRAAVGPDPDLAETARRAMTEHPLLRPLLSADREATIFRVRVGEMTVAELRPLIASLGAVIGQDLSGTELEGRVTGVPVLRAETVHGLQRDQVVFMLLGLVLGVAIAWFLFRSVAAIAIVSFPALLAVIWTLGGMGWIGQPLNVLNNVVSTLTLVIALADAVHLLHHARLRWAAGDDPVAAARTALSIAGPACAITSLTTILAFGALAGSPLDFLHRFGVVCALGMACAFAAAVLGVPLLAQGPLGRAASRESARAEGGRPLFGALGNMVVRRSGRTVLIGGAVLALLALVGVGLEADYRYREYLPEGSAALDGLRRLESRFGGSMPVEVLVTWPAGTTGDELAATLSEVETALVAPGFGGEPFSVLSVLRSQFGDDLLQGGGLPEPSAWIAPGWILAEERRALVRIPAMGRGAAALEPDFRETEERLHRIQGERPGFDLRLTGLLVVSSRAALEMISTLAWSLAIAAALIFAVVAVFLRSWRLGLSSLPVNVLPLAALASYLVLSGRPLQFTTVTLFTVCLGISVDDSIHLLVAIRRHLRAGDDPRAAVREAIVETGPALLSTTALLLGGFGVLAFSAWPLLRLFGLLACGAFVVALLADLVLLPALVVLLEPDRRRPA